MLRWRIGGATEPHQLDLVELVHAQQATRILARCTGLAAETRRVCDIALRQRGAVEDLVAMQIGDGHFRRRHEKEIVADDAIDVVFEFGQLPGAGHDFAPYQKWRLDFDVTVLARVEVEHEVDQPAGEPGTGTHQEGKPRASELRAPR